MTDPFVIETRDLRKNSVMRARISDGWPGARYLDRSSPGAAGLAWPSGITAGPLLPSSHGASSTRNRCRCRTLRFRLI